MMFADLDNEIITLFFGRRLGLVFDSPFFCLLPLGNALSRPGGSPHTFFALAGMVVLTLRIIIKSIQLLNFATSCALFGGGFVVWLFFVFFLDLFPLIHKARGSLNIRWHRAVPIPNNFY